MKLRILISITAIALAACGRSNPGPVAGTWRLNGPIAMLIQYREGETESMGFIEKVSYDVKGPYVIVTTESGPMAGTAFRLRVIDTNTLQTDLGTMHRVR